MLNFVDGFCLSLQNVIPDNEIRVIKDRLEIYSASYVIEPMTTELVEAEYRLPQEFYLYLASKQQDGRMSRKSYEQYFSCLSRMLYDLSIPLTQITTNHIRLHISHISTNQRTGKPLSQVTLDQRKCIIRSFFQWLLNEEYIDRDPSARIKPVKPYKKPRDAFQDVQIESLRDACKTDRDRAIVDLLTASGIRISECTSLSKGDLNLDQREINVLGKGGKYRVAYLDARVVVSLERYLESRNDDNNALFVTLRKPHSRLTNNAVRKMLHALDVSASTGNVIPHRFRYTMATTAISNGMPVESLQVLMGHSSITTTMHYAHVTKMKVKRDHDTYIR